MSTKELYPTEQELFAIFLSKYGKPEDTGWAPQRRLRFGYYLATDVYEALVNRCVYEGSRWLDVGAGESPFPENKGLAAKLAKRAALMVGIDPSDNLQKNPFVHERAQCLLEDFHSTHTFDVATLRMVAEHVADPPRVIQALQRLLRPGGKAIVYTVYAYSPLTLLSRATPFWMHTLFKRLWWAKRLFSAPGGPFEKETFPVAYKMNTHRRLKGLFDRGGFDEVLFAYLDDCCLTYRSYYLNYVELSARNLLHRLRLAYPECNLLGVYQKR